MRVDAVVDAVANEFGLPADWIVSRRRSADVVAARWMSITLASRLTGWLDKQIAATFSREASTVGHARRCAEAMIARDPHLASRIARIEQRLMILDLEDQLKQRLDELRLAMADAFDELEQIQRRLAAFDARGDGL